MICRPYYWYAHHTNINPLIIMKTWLIAMQCFQKMFHFLSVFNGLSSTLSDISITLRKPLKTIFVGYFWKVTNTSTRYFWEVSETSQNRHLFEICLRRLKDVTKRTSFLRYIWHRMFIGDEKTALKQLCLYFLYWSPLVSGSIIKQN